MSLIFHFQKDLFLRKILYLVINIDQEDYIVVPPLKGFVMNRVQGDYFENLLYKIFVSINEHTTIGELATVLQLPLKEVQVSQSVSQSQLEGCLHDGRVCVCIF